jgi:hypothetical protein
MLKPKNPLLRWLRFFSLLLDEPEKVNNLNKVSQ